MGSLAEMEPEDALRTILRSLAIANNMLYSDGSVEKDPDDILQQTLENLWRLEQLDK